MVYLNYNTINYIINDYYDEIVRYLGGIRGDEDRDIQNV